MDIPRRCVGVHWESLGFLGGPSGTPFGVLGVPRGPGNVPVAPGEGPGDTENTEGSLIGSEGGPGEPLGWFWTCLVVLRCDPVGADDCISIAL